MDSSELPTNVRIFKKLSPCVPMIRGDTTITSINFQSIDSSDYYLPTTKGFYENGSTYYKWRIYAGGESNANIKADYFYYLKKVVNNPVVSLQGNGIKSGYILGDIDGARAWHNKTQTKISWEMIKASIFTVYVPIKTTQGIRYMTYTNHPDHRNKRGKEGRLIYMGTNNINTESTIFTKNLRQDLAKYEPNNTLLEVNGFMVRGSCLIDDVKLKTEEKPKTSTFDVKKFKQLVEEQKHNLLVKLGKYGQRWENIEIHYSQAKENIAWITYNSAHSGVKHLQIFTLNNNQNLKPVSYVPPYEDYSKGYGIPYINYNVKFIENNTRMLLKIEDGFNKVERIDYYIYNLEQVPFRTELLKGHLNR